MKYFFRSLLLVSDGSDYPKALDKMPDEWQRLSTTLKDDLKYNGELTFLIGPWGAGKSTFLSTFLKDFRGKKQRISMSTATDLDEVFSHLIDPKIKLIYLIIAAIVFVVSLGYVTLIDDVGSLLEKNVTALALATGFGYMFITNKFRLFYIFSSYFESLSGRKVKIIEDFDRGSLTNSEIYNSLFFRFKRKVSYIVPVGYHTEARKIELIELAMKLNAKIALFNISEKSLYGILEGLVGTLPVKAGIWIKPFTARRIISIATKITSNVQGVTDREKYFITLGILFEELCFEMGLSDLKKIEFARNTTQLEPTSELSARESALLESFLSCMDQAQFHAHGHTEPLDNDVQKWPQVVLNKYLKKRWYRNDPRFTVEFA